MIKPVDTNTVTIWITENDSYLVSEFLPLNKEAIGTNARGESVDWQAEKTHHSLRNMRNVASSQSTEKKSHWITA